MLRLQRAARLRPTLANHVIGVLLGLRPGSSERRGRGKLCSPLATASKTPHSPVRLPSGWTRSLEIGSSTGHVPTSCRSPHGSSLGRFERLTAAPNVVACSERGADPSAAAEFLRCSECRREPSLRSSTAHQVGSMGDMGAEASVEAMQLLPRKRKAPSNRALSMERTGIEPVTSGLQRRRVRLCVRRGAFEPA